MALFFVFRVDTEMDKRLQNVGTPKALALRALRPAAPTHAQDDAQRCGTWVAAAIGVGRQSAPALIHYRARWVSPASIKVIPIGDNPAALR